MDFGEFFRKVNGYAGNNGFGAAFPDFHQLDPGDGLGVRYGVVCIKQEAVEVRSVPDSVIDPPVKGIQFPIIRHKHTELGDHRRMDTTVKVMENGKVVGRTKTWTSKHYEGFHGTVIVDFTDKPECTIDSVCNSYGDRIIHTYGVDGVGVGDPSRTEYWTATIPQNELEHIFDISIVHNKTTKKTTASDVQEWVKALEPIIKAAAEAGGSSPS